MQFNEINEIIITIGFLQELLLLLLFLQRLLLLLLFLQGLLLLLLFLQGILLCTLHIDIWELCQQLSLTFQKISPLGIWGRLFVLLAGREGGRDTKWHNILPKCICPSNRKRPSKMEVQHRQTSLLVSVCQSQPK